MNTSKFRCSFGAISSDGVYRNTTMLLCPCPMTSRSEHTNLSIDLVDKATVNLATFPFAFANPFQVKELLPSFAFVSERAVIKVKGGEFYQNAKLTCLFGHLSATAKVESSSIIHCLYPGYAVPGKIIFELQCSDLSLPASLQNPNKIAFEVIGTSFSHFSPTISQSYPGSSLAIHGRNFMRHQCFDCIFGLDISSPAAWQSSSVLKCNNPLQDPGNVTISLSLNTFIVFKFHQTLKVVDIPRLFSLSPSAVSSTVANLITVFGENFDSRCRCEIERLSVETIFLNAFHIICSIGEIGPEETSVHVAIMNPDTSMSNNLTLTLLQDLTLIPSKGPTMGGNVIALHIPSLESNPFVARLLNATFEFKDERSLFEIVVPPSPKSGLSDLKLFDTNENLIYKSIYEFFEEPQIFNVDPSEVASTGGTRITLCGKNLDPQIGFHLGFPFGKQMQIEWTSLTMISTTTVPGLPGLTLVTVESNLYNFSSGFSIKYVALRILKITLTYLNLFEYSFQIYGEGFDRSCLCSISNIHSQMTLLHSPTFISCKSSGQLSARLTVKIVCSHESAAALYEHHQQANLSEMHPTAAITGSPSLISLTGEGFPYPESRFGVCFVMEDFLVPGQFVSSSKALCQVPSFTNSGTKSIHIPLNQIQPESQFFIEILEAPAIHRLRPSLITPSTLTVTILGSNFYDRLSWSCHLGSRLFMSGTRITQSLLLCFLPSHSLEGNMTMSLYSQTGKQESQSFCCLQILPKPEILLLEPSTSLLHEEVSVATQVKGFFIEEHSELACVFREIKDIVSKDLTIRASLESLQLLICDSSSFSTVGSFDFGIRVGDGNVVWSHKKFLVKPGIVLNRIYPSFGPASGGTRVIFEFQDRLQHDQYYCLFGSFRVPMLQQNRTNEYLCVSPTHMQSTIDLQAFSMASNHAIAKHSFIYSPPILIQGASPSFRQDIITVFGRNFVNVTSLTCFLDGTKVPGIWTSENAIICRRLNDIHVFSTISVSNNGLDMDSNIFVMSNLKPPLILNVRPSVVLLTGIQVTVFGRNFRYCRSCWSIDNQVLQSHWISSTETRLLMPARSLGKHSIFHNIASNAFLSPKIEVEYVNASNQIRIHPTRGSILNGCPITITGIFHRFNRIDCIFGETSMWSRAIFLNAQYVCNPPNLESVKLKNLTTSRKNVSLLIDQEFMVYTGVFFEYHIVPQIVQVSITPLASNFPESMVTIVGSHLNFLGDSHILLARDMKADLTIISSSLAECMIPEAWSSRGNVTFGIFSNDCSNPIYMSFIYSSSLITVSLVQGLKLRIDKVTPTSGWLKGEIIAVFGRHLDLRLMCHFSGSEQMTYVRALDVSSSFVQCQVPAEVSGNFTLTLSDSTNGMVLFHSGLFQSDRDRIVVSSVQPTVFCSRSRVTFTLTGSFLGTSKPKYCSITGITTVSDAVVVSRSILRCAFPPLDPDPKQKISVIDRDGLKSNSLQIQGMHALNIIGLLPSSGPIFGGTAVNVYALTTSIELAQSCCFDMLCMPILSKSQNYISCLSPARINSTNVSFIVSSQDRLVDCHSNSVSFLYWEEVNLYNLEPSAGPLSGGTTVKIAGTFGSPSRVIVRFGAEQIIEAQILSTSLVQCVNTPVNRSGYVTIEISLDGGEYIRTNLSFQYYDRSKIIDVVPRLIPNQRSRIIILAEINLDHSSKVGCLLSKQVFAGEWLSCSRILCFVHVQKEGNYSISVASPSNSIRKVSSDIMLQVYSRNLVNGPFLILFSGARVDLTSIGLNENSNISVGCKLNNSKIGQAYTCHHNRSRFCCTLPQGYGGNLVLSIIDLSSLRSIYVVSVQILEKPEIHVLNPTDSITAKDRSISVIGANFLPNLVQIMFDKEPAGTTFVSSTLLICTLPPHPPGPSLVSLYYNSTLVELKETIVFTYHNPPRILRVYPDVVVTSRSQVITVTGEDFVPSA
eukprot:764840-Hanusia_phi.AAC.1